MGRLYQTAKAGVVTRFGYDGIDLIAEYNASNAVLRRYVHGPGIDNPITWYEGSAISSATRRFLMADERGSVVSITDSAGATIAINAYDEYGIPAPGNVGRFGYTGQTWLPDLGLWYYKARIYSPTLGRFLQTDPIGYADGMNWYNYVGGDPVNFVDPLGLERKCGMQLVKNGYTVWESDGSFTAVAPKLAEICWDSPIGFDDHKDKGPPKKPNVDCAKLRELSDDAKRIAPSSSVIGKSVDGAYPDRWNDIHSLQNDIGQIMTNIAELRSIQDGTQFLAVVAAWFPSPQTALSKTTQVLGRGTITTTVFFAGKGFEAKIAKMESQINALNNRIKLLKAAQAGACKL